MSESKDRRSQSELRALLATIEEAGWEYARLELDGIRLEISKNSTFAPGGETGAVSADPASQLDGSAPDIPVAPSVPAETASGPTATGPLPSAGPPSATVLSELVTVTSPTIGLVWRSPKPGAPPFVEVGDTVQAGSTVCIVEVMKLMTHVVAPVSGIVHSVHVSNGDAVEHGKPLIDIEPTDSEGAL